MFTTDLDRSGSDSSDADSASDPPSAVEEEHVRVKNPVREREEAALRRQQEREERRVEREKLRAEQRAERQQQRVADKEARRLESAKEKERERERRATEKEQERRQRERGQSVLQFTLRQQRRRDEAAAESEKQLLASVGASEEPDDSVAALLKEREATDDPGDEVDALLAGSTVSAADIFFSDLTAEPEPEQEPELEPQPQQQPQPQRERERAVPPRAAATAPRADAARTREPDTALKRNFTVHQHDEQPKARGPVASFASSVPADAKAVAPDGGPLRLHWTDAREERPGQVLLFGKLHVGGGCFESACVRVQDVPRQVYFLPRRTRTRADGGEEPIPLIDCMKEIMAYCRGRGIERRRVKPVQRWYAFEVPGVPHECTQWLKLTYAAQHGGLGFAGQPADAVQQRLSTVTHVFGDDRSSLEMLLLKRRVMGPCWLDLQQATAVPSSQRVSHCRHECTIPSYKHVAVSQAPPPPPPLRVMAIGTFVHLNEAAKVNEVVAVSCVTWHHVSSEGLSPPEQPTRWAAARAVGSGQELMPHLVSRAFRSAALPEAVCEISERQLLMHLLDTLEREDPDVLVGHSFLSFDLDVLLHRMERLKVPHWSKLGRLQQRVMPKLQAGAGGVGEATWGERHVLAGRVVADSYLLSREHHKTQNYKLRALAAEFGLQGVRGDWITAATVDQPFITDVQAATHTPEGVVELVTRCDDKALLAMGVLQRLQVIPLTRRLTCLAGNLWQRTLSGARAERIEYLLLHHFHEAKFVVPDKRPRWNPAAGKRGRDGDEPDEASKRKAKYTGGMVLDPKKGLYSDYVVLLDFNSLYPSLMQEYFICFTTVRRPEEDGATPETPDESQLVCAKCAAGGHVPAGSGILGSCPHRCLLPKGIRELVLARRKAKSRLAAAREPAERAQLDVVQKALKLTANSIYGCLGFENSRFYAQSLAQLVTLKGRQALKDTVDLVPTLREATPLQVIYGDTDSVMVSTGISSSLREAVAVAGRLKQEVNQKYALLEIDIDGVFRSLLLVRKKKYAAMVVDDWRGEGVQLRQETKGLDLVRRDWCGLSADVQQFVLQCCLSGQEQDKVSDDILQHLEAVARRVRCEAGAEPLPLEKYIIRKSLTKDPERYADAAAQPHVQVALRLRARQLPVRAGDIIQYVVCKGQEDGDRVAKRLADRAYHPDEVQANDRLFVDEEWYLATQLHPPVSRLCEHITGLDSHALANALGVEGSGLVHHGGGEHGQGPTTAHSSHVPSMLLVGRAVEERFPDRVEIAVKCARCAASYAVDPAAAYGDAAARVMRHAAQNKTLPTDRRPLLRCSNCDHPTDLKLLYNTVVHAVRAVLRIYYRGEHGLEANHEDAAEYIGKEYRECFVRQQFAYLKARFCSAEEVEHVVAGCVDKEPKEALAALEPLLRRADPTPYGEKTVAVLLRECVDRLATDGSGGAVSAALEPLATYTRLLAGTPERAHVSLKAVFRPFRRAAPAPQAVPAP
eukprot:TRINITY_DN42866_c0_g1_i1.p1 TRINITY_DN42866_c0_g1~~TRINITY_DN42866_c0_g1_i1.p1  ORF type:complete len:1502 (+),score=522.94 TRINITY_DN42866_c0_g1_i1:58-4506(+)